MVETSKQFYINIEDKPYWNPTKPYDQQSRDAKQFMVEEAKKLKKGLNINGVKIHPWLYWHVNFWNMMVDKKVEGNPLPISVPEVAHLRDNEWLLQQSLIRSEELNKGIIGFGARRLGKELADYEPVITPRGEIPIGEIKVGDIAFGRDGKETIVTHVFPQGVKPIFRMYLLDGRYIDSGLEHQWTVITNKGERTYTTRELLGKKLSYEHKKSGKSYPFKLPECKPVQFPEKEFIIPPYLLGILLGDGKLGGGIPQFSSKDGEVNKYIQECLSEEYVISTDINSKKSTGYDCSFYIKYIGKDKYKKDPKGHNPISREIKRLGLTGNFSKKFIPEEYKYASVEQRMELLRGLLDSDGSANSEGGIEFSVKNERLANDVSWLCRSLGIRCQQGYENLGWIEKEFPGGKVRNIYSEKWRVYIRTDLDVFKLERKRQRIKNRKRTSAVSIERIEYIGDHSATCIMVDNDDHLFLTKDFIVTHNSGFISSFTAFNATTIYGGELRVDSIVGGSQEDLDNITSYIDFGLDKIHPFFKMDKVGKDWSKGVTLGTRNVDNTKEIYSTITVTNINKGAISSSQKTAGATPKSSIWDEIGKFSFMKAFNAFKYSIATQYGWRTTPLLFGCLTENNKVWTANGDLISIKDLKASDGIIGFDRNDGEFSVEPITHQQNNYKKRCIKITTSTGKSVECSYDHPILTKFRNRTKYNKQTKKANRLVEFVEAENLKVGDTICVINTLPIFGQEEIKHARLIGQLIGDGTYGIDHGVRISTCDKEVYEPIFNLFNTRIEKTYKTKDGKDFYTIYIKEFTQYLRDLGIHNQTKENKTLPVNTFRLTKESLAEMIGGIFDADGHVCLNKSKNRYTIGLTIGHKELLDEIVLGLLKFGIHGTINFHPGTDSGFGKGKGCYVLTISDKHSIFNFFENISFSIEYKQNKLKEVYEFCRIKNSNNTKSALNKNPLMKGLRSERIISIEEVGEQYVYNLTADRTNTYLAGAIVTHNTGGVVEFSRDAQKMVNNPSAYNMITMDWSQIGEDGMRKPWVEREWGVFMPGQMSLDAGVPKKYTTLSKFLKIEDAYLDAIEIQVSDWKTSTEIIEKRRQELKKADLQAYTDEVMFMPLDPDDCFLDGGKNPFPVAEANKTLNRIRIDGDTGRVVDVFPLPDKSGHVEITDSKKPIAKFPFEGGILDCAIKMFEEPPEDNSFDFTYVAGLDHYKHVESTGDSIGSLTIFKRKVNINDEFSDSIVCTFASRPASMATFNRTCEILIEAYGAQCLQENADISFQQYLEAKGKDIKLLANGQEIVNRMISPDARQVNKYGLSPTAKNKEYYFNLVVTYCWEELEAYIDKDGNEVKILGVERIKDEELLQEIIEWKPGRNVDRITSFGHALVWARYLDDIRVIPKVKGQKVKKMTQEIYNEKMDKIRSGVRNKYGTRKFSPYGSRRR